MTHPVREYKITAHAVFEMRRREIGEEVIEKILRAPEQRIAVRPGRDVFQSQIEIKGKAYLVRIFVDIDRHPADVVTVYKTSQINKYWEDKP